MKKFCSPTHANQLRDGDEIWKIWSSVQTSQFTTEMRRKMEDTEIGKDKGSFLKRPYYVLAHLKWALIHGGKDRR